MRGLQDKAAIITGGGGGIGGAPCRRVAEAGTAVAKTVASVEAIHGRVDILVNNAGWDVFRLFNDSTPAEWQTLIAVNLVGALNMHHAVRNRAIGPARSCSSPATMPRSSPGRSSACPVD